jgi:long-chain acyl-CoA synthetase
MRIEDFIFKNAYNDHAICCIDDSGEWKYNQLNERVEKLKESLLAGGVNPLDRVAVISENSSSFIVAVLSVLSVGAVPVPIDPQVPYLPAVELMIRCKARHVLVSGLRPEKNFLKPENEAHKGKIQILSEAQGHWELKGELPGEVKHDKWEESENIDHTHEPALILLSSGTSGESKGVLLTHEAIIHNINAIMDYMKPTHKDIFYIAKTVVHCSTLIGELFVALRAGARIIMQNPVVPPSVILKRIESLKPTIICVNPTLLRLLVMTKGSKYDVSSIRLLYTSGAVAGEELLKRAEEYFSGAKVLNVYGLTEAGPRVTAQRADEKIKYGSVGKPIRGVQVAVRDNNNNLCVPGSKGVVYVKSPSIMLGYIKDHMTIKDKICDGWLNTGDIGYLDEDGDLFITGRADEMINRGSHNVDPNRIEREICKMDGIAGCIVFGVPDKINGQNIVCAYVKETGSCVKPEDIIEHLKNGLSSYEYPQSIVEWSELPRTTGGKLSRRLALEQYLKTKG